MENMVTEDINMEHERPENCDLTDSLKRQCDDNELHANTKKIKSTYIPEDESLTEKLSEEKKSATLGKEMEVIEEGKEIESTTVCDQKEETKTEEQKIKEEQPIVEAEVKATTDSDKTSKQKAVENTVSFSEEISKNVAVEKIDSSFDAMSKEEVEENITAHSEEISKHNAVEKTYSGSDVMSKQEVVENTRSEEEEKLRLEEEKKRKEYEAMYTPDGKRRKTPELIKFWKAVEDDPNDFTGWTYLLQHVDAAGVVDHAREAYDQFLFRYPYCYGYWKKYADFEKRNEERESCIMVFERGVKAIALSADLWIHYLNHIRDVSKDQPEFIRSQYERSIEQCGQEWRSDKLWDHYVKWEINLEDSKGEFEEATSNEADKHYGKVLNLYKRILKNETQGLSHQFDMFRDFVKDKTPKQLLDINDFLALRKEVLESVAQKKVKKETSSKSESGHSDKEDESRSLDEAAPGDGTDHFAISAEEENQAMREKIIKEQKKMFKETEEKVQARWKYEDNIKRPYFHMKPLERSQLKNWSDYLAHEMKKSCEEKAKGGKGNDTKIEILFERCLIACALYEEFWIKYTNWIKETSIEQKVEKLRNVYRRACVHHLPKKVDIHLAWAAFEEQEQNYESCSDILKNLEAQHPELMSIRLNRIHLERRQGNIDEVHRIYKHCIKEAKSPSVSSGLSIKYARFLRLWPSPVNFDSDGAIKVIEEALIKDDKNPRLYLQLLDIYMHSKPLDYQKIMDLFAKTLSVEAVKVDGKDKIVEDIIEKDTQCVEMDAQNEENRIKVEKGTTEKNDKIKYVPFLPAKDRFLFSQRKLDFLKDFCPNINDVLVAQDEHTKLKVEIKPSNTTPCTESKISEARVDKKKNNHGNGTSTYNPVVNSATYGASHTNQYQQYGSRYNQHYPTSGYSNQHNNYYGQGVGYAGQAGGTGSSYGSNYGKSY